MMLKRSRHRSICSRLQDFFLIDELRKEVDPTDPFYANWIQSIIYDGGQTPVIHVQKKRPAHLSIVERLGGF